jgi:Erythromycin esterase/Phosphoribosyl transferase domain
MSSRLFRDRRDAGRHLASLLDKYRARPDVIVLGLPRGGVPVAYEVATALGAPLDVFLVRKLGVPGRDGRMQKVRPALADSGEEHLHGAGKRSSLLTSRPAPRSGDVPRSGRLERAIGVIYRPESERQRHDFRARVADRFDAVIHVDETGALEPLERTARWDEGEVAETYPFGV